MQRDKPRFVLSQLDVQAFSDNGPRLLPQLKLLRIEALNVPQQHVFDRQPFLLALNREVAVIGQGDIQTFLQFPQPLRRQPDDAVAGGHHLQRDLAQQLTETLHQLIAL